MALLRKRFQKNRLLPSESLNLFLSKTLITFPQLLQDDITMSLQNFQPSTLQQRMLDPFLSYATTVTVLKVYSIDPSKNYTFLPSQLARINISLDGFYWEIFTFIVKKQLPSSSTTTYRYRLFLRPSWKELQSQLNPGTTQHMSTVKKCIMKSFRLMKKNPSLESLNFITDFVLVDIFFHKGSLSLYFPFHQIFPQGFLSLTTLYFVYSKQAMVIKLQAWLGMSPLQADYLEPAQQGKFYQEAHCKFQIFNYSSSSYQSKEIRIVGQPEKVQRTVWGQPPVIFLQLPFSFAHTFSRISTQIQLLQGFTCANNGFPFTVGTKSSTITQVGTPLLYTRTLKYPSSRLQLGRNSFQIRKGISAMEVMAERKQQSPRSPCRISQGRTPFQSNKTADLQIQDILDHEIFDSLPSKLPKLLTPAWNYTSQNLAPAFCRAIKSGLLLDSLNLTTSKLGSLISAQVMDYLIQALMEPARRGIFTQAKPSSKDFATKHYKNRLVSSLIMTSEETDLASLILNLCKQINSAYNRVNRLQQIKFSCLRQYQDLKLKITQTQEKIELVSKNSDISSLDRHFDRFQKMINIMYCSSILFKDKFNDLHNDMLMACRAYQVSPAILQKDNAQLQKDLSLCQPKVRQYLMILKPKFRTSIKPMQMLKTARSLIEIFRDMLKKTVTLTIDITTTYTQQEALQKLFFQLCQNHQKNRFSRFSRFSKMQFPKVKEFKQSVIQFKPRNILPVASIIKKMQPKQSLKKSRTEVDIPKSLAPKHQLVKKSQSQIRRFRI